MNVSFAGVGFLGIYYVGATACLKKHGVHLNIEKAAGASAGALAAAWFLTNPDLGTLTSCMQRTVTVVRKRTLGAFSPAFNVDKELRNCIEKILPLDAHELCSGRLFISVTRLPDLKNVMLSQYSSRKELIDVIMCSSFVPGFSGLVPPSVNGVQYIDGFYSDDLPRLDANTITVSPFAGEGDICPMDNTSGLLMVNLNNLPMDVSMKNIRRMKYVLFPPSAEVFYRLCEQGYKDTADFLRRTNLIKCASCLDLERISLPEAPVKSDNQKPLDRDHCRDCYFTKQEVLRDNLPSNVSDVLQCAVEDDNGFFTSFLFQFKLMRIIALIWQPFVFIYDLLIYLFFKDGYNAKIVKCEDKKRS